MRRPHVLNIFWFLVGGLGLLCAFLVQSPNVALVMYSFLFLLILSSLTSRLWIMGLDCERIVNPTTLREGEDIEVQVAIRNTRFWFVPWIYVEDSVPSGFPVIGDNKKLAVLMPGQILHFSYKIRCPKRGYHQIGPLMMETGDLFGLQKYFRMGVRRDYVSVLPTVAYIETFSLNTRRPQGPVRISHRVYEDPTRISGIRGYVPGDPLNRIHWKVSARMSTLFVKTNEPSNVLGATLILDLFHAFYIGEQGEERFELAITVAASIAYLLQLSGEQVGLLTNARDAAEIARYEVVSKNTYSKRDLLEMVEEKESSVRISPLEVATRRSPVQAQLIIENLARVLPSEELDAVTLIMSSYRRLPRDAALIPIVPKITPELCDTLAVMKDNGFSVTVFLIKDNRNFEEMAGRLAENHIYCFHIQHERDLHQLSPQFIGR